MGKNARRRKEAKLQEKMKRGEASEFISSLVSQGYELPAVFRTEEHEPITPELIQQLVTQEGLSEEMIREGYEAGFTHYCRERNSFVKPSQSFD